MDSQRNKAEGDQNLFTPLLVDSLRAEIGRGSSLTLIPDLAE